MKTKTNIKFEMFDTTAKEDSSVDIEDKQDFVDLSDLLLEAGELTEIKYGTLEKNQFALDGTFELMPDELDDMGLWSSSMTDENGDFATPPVLEVTFTEVHSSAGLTLLFSKAGDYCNYANVKYYDSDDNILADEDFYPDDYLYIYNLNVENYTKLVITFYSTNNPYRYLKLYRIDYGIEKNFAEDSLISANILEEVDLLSSEVSINTLNFTAYSDDDEFNIINPDGVYSCLQERQKLKVTEIINENEEKNMGTFYLDDWESKDDKNMEMKAIDLTGLIDKTDFLGGMYEDVTVSELVAEVMTSAGVDSDYYEIEEDLQDFVLTGYIPICTHREALQQIAFAINAVVDCSRSDKIKIYTVSIDEDNIVNTFDSSNRFEGSKKIERNDIVTNIELTLHTYEEDEDKEAEIDEEKDEDLTDDEYIEQYDELCSITVEKQGVYILKFDEPAYNLIPVAEIATNSSNNYTRINDFLKSYNCNSATIEYDFSNYYNLGELFALSLAKKYYKQTLDDEDDSSVYYRNEAVESDENTGGYTFIVSVRDSSTTSALEWYYVDFVNSTITREGEEAVAIDDDLETTIKIFGIKYIHNETVYKAGTSTSSNSSGDNTLQITSSYLLNMDNVKDVAQHIFDYYDNTFTNSLQTVLDEEELTDTVTEDTGFEQNLIGNITKLDIDLTGGFIADVEMVSTIQESDTSG